VKSIWQEAEFATVELGQQGQTLWGLGIDFGKTRGDGGKLGGIPEWLTTA
jgi:hypothetical protein